MMNLMRGGKGLLRNASSNTLRTFSTSEAPTETKRDPALIKQEYDSMFAYARDNLVYKCGNLTDMPSRFGWFRRWRLEKQINYNNIKHPIFLYAYRAFIDALAKHDKETL